MPTLADFDQEEQAKIRQVLGMKPDRRKPDRSLLSFAKENNLRVTSGYSQGGHNNGSKHYQGDAQHPGAVDVDHRGVTPEMVRKWESQGIRVVDETRRPKGQRVWTGSHYHLEYGQAPTPAPVKQRPSSVPSVVGQVGTVAPPDLTNVGHLFKTDNNGLTTRITTKPRDFGKEIAKAASGVDAGIKARQSATIDMSQFEAEDQTKIADVLASLQRPEVQPPQAAPPKADTNFFGDVVNSALNAGSAGILDLPHGNGVGAAIGGFAGPALGTIGAILAAPETGGASIAIPATYLGLVGGGTKARELANEGRLDFGSIPQIGASTVGNAVMGALGPVGKGLGLVPRVLANAAINAAGETGLDVADQLLSKPLAKFDLGQTGQRALIGAGLGAGLGATHGKLAAKHPDIAAKVQSGQPLTPQETARAHAVITPEETAALTEAWRQRTVGETKPIQQSVADPAQVMREMAPRGVEQVSDTGLVVPKAGEKPKVNMEMGSALPEGQRVDMGQPSPIHQPELMPPTTDIARALEREFGILDKPQKVRSAAEIKADENGMLKNGLQYLSRHPEYQDTPGLDFLDSIGIKSTQAKDIGGGLDYRVRVGGETYIVPRSIGVGGLVQRVGLDRLTNAIKQRGGLNAVKSLIDDVTRSGEAVGDIDALNQYRQFAERGATVVDGDTRLMQQAAIDTADGVRKIQAAKSKEELDQLFDEAFNKTPNVAGRDNLHVALVDAYDETLARIDAAAPRDPNALRTSKDIALEKASRPDYGTQPDIVGPARDVRAVSPEPVNPPRLLDASGREMGNQSAPRDLGQVEPPRPLLDAQGREMGRPAEPVKNSEPIQTQVDPRPVDGAFIDTINEMAKDTGLDYNGLRDLKASLDNRKELAQGVFKGSKTPEAQRIRQEYNQFKEQWKSVDDNIKELLKHEIDPATGMGKQSPINPESQLTLDQIRGELSPATLPLAERYAEAMQREVIARHKYIGEQKGRSNEVAKQSKGGRVVVEASEFSPTHFGHYNATFADGQRKVPAVFGYNQRGHEVGYYLEPSPKGSRVQQVMSVTDKPAFKGAIPNVYKGPGEFNAANILARGPRTERGFVKTSDAIRAIHEQKKAIRGVASNTMMTADAKQALARMLEGKDLSFDDVQLLKKNMDSPDRLAQFCKNMGLK